MKVFCQGPTCNIFRFPHSRLKDKALSPPFDAVSIGLIKKGNIIPDGWRICLIGTELVVCCNDCIKYVKKGGDAK